MLYYVYFSTIKKKLGEYTVFRLELLFLAIIFSTDLISRIGLGPLTGF